MKNKVAAAKTYSDQRNQGPHNVRLPGFINDGEVVGLGDAIKRTTAYFGITPCGGCSRRADTLNRWIIFTNRQSQ